LTGPRWRWCRKYIFTRSPPSFSVAREKYHCSRLETRDH